MVSLALERRLREVEEGGYEYGYECGGGGGWGLDEVFEVEGSPPPSSVFMRYGCWEEG
jgi:hypothetical protein